MSIRSVDIPKEPGLLEPRTYRFWVIFPPWSGIERLAVQTAEHVGPMMRELYPNIPLNEMRFERIDPPITFTSRMITRKESN